MPNPAHYDRLFQKWMKPEAAWCCLIVLFAAWLRFDGLAARSLWGDEFCTWKVAQLPLTESLHWQPELTKPPLYQFVLRGIAGQDADREGTDLHQDARVRVPEEWHLRVPAAVCGTLAVAAAWWLGSMAGGWTVGAAASLLFAANTLQIDYSQEARPYSMLVLGSLVSTGSWYRLNAEIQSPKFKVQNRRALWWAVAYVLVTAATFHANYLMGLTIAAHGAWLLMPVVRRGPNTSWTSQIRDNLLPMMALSTTAAFCIPIVWHFLQHRTSVFQGLDWIAPATVGTAFHVLGEITFGWIWVVGLLAALVIAVLSMVFPNANRESQIESECSSTLPVDLGMGGGYCKRSLSGLLLIWFAVAWGGLLAISWLAHPAMVARYALPAAAPAILLPLIVLHRWDRRLPLLAAVLFVVGTSPVWATRKERVKPGFREMVAFLDEYTDPQQDAVVVAIERTTSPGWEEMDLLGFEYYWSLAATKPKSREEKINVAKRQQGNEAAGTSPHHRIATSSRRTTIEVLYLRGGRADGEQPILRDPRALWMVMFLADPMVAIESAGRRVEQIEIEDKVFDQLYFEPYRLIRVAATK